MKSFIGLGISAFKFVSFSTVALALAALCFGITGSSQPAWQDHASGRLSGRRARLLPGAALACCHARLLDRDAALTFSIAAVLDSWIGAALTVSAGAAAHRLGRRHLHGRPSPILYSQ